MWTQFCSRCGGQRPDAGRGHGARRDAQAGRRDGRHLQERLTTLDPAIGYDWQNWSMIKSLFDGLMDYKPGTTELVPTSPRATRSPTTA